MATESYQKMKRNLLNYTNIDMNLKLDDDKQVYLGIIDVPNNSIIENNEVFSIGMIFGLNTHFYAANGNFKVDLEKNNQIMSAMNSLLISSGQVLSDENLVSLEKIDFTGKKQLILKANKGLYRFYLDGTTNDLIFLEKLTNKVIREVLKEL